MVNVESDLKSIVERVGSTWDTLRKTKILVTGGTGFFGRWLLDSFFLANRHFGLSSEVWVVSRNPQHALAMNPHWKNEKCLHWIQSEVTRFDFPEGEFSSVIHAATDVFRPSGDPFSTIEVGFHGTERVIQFCKARGVENLLLTSSGAVYGRQPSDLDRIPETYLGSSPLDPNTNAYTFNKRLSEWLVLNSPSLSSTRVSIARGFAFAGPLFPLNGSLALSNFTERVLRNEPIEISGDGTALRSYMDGTDLTTWLWQLLVKGPDRSPVNVGSDQAISIKELAEIIVSASGRNLRIEVAKQATKDRPERYIPSIEKARSLGMELKVNSETAVRRTYGYHANRA